METSHENFDPREDNQSSPSSGGNCCDGGGGETRLKKGPWTPDEDTILREYLKKNGVGRWNSVQKYSGLARCAKSCRLRWTNHLNPNIKKGFFTPEEEMIIVKLHAKYGNKWARMATKLPGRTDNEIKNYWHTRMKRRLKQGLSLYPEITEGGLSPEHHLNNTINHQNKNSNNNDTFSPNLRLTPNMSANQNPLFLSIPQPQSSPQQHIISSFHRLPSPHNLSSSPRNLSLAQPFSPTYQSTLSLIDPSAIAFTNSRNPPILSSPLGRFKRFQSTNNGLSLPFQSNALPSSLLSHSSPITSLPLSPSPSSIGLSSSPIPRTQYKSGCSFSFNSDLPSSPLSQTTPLKSTNIDFSSSQLSPRIALKSTNSTNIELFSSKSSQVADLKSIFGTNVENPSSQSSPNTFKSAITTNLQLPSNQLSPMDLSKSTIDSQISLCRARSEGDNRLLEALISPRGVKTKRKRGSLNDLSQIDQAEDKSDLLDDMLREHQESAYGTNLGHRSSTEESRREVQVRESLKTEDFLGKRLTREGLMASQEQNCMLDGFGMVSRQSTIPSQLGSVSENSSLHSFAVEKAKEGQLEDQINSMTDELSSLLEYFPATVQVPEWYRNEQETLKEPSQREVEVNLGLEIQKDQNTSWNNMPGFS